MWSQGRVQRLLFVFWFLTVVQCIPLIYPIKGGHYEFVSPVRTVGIALEVLGTIPNLIYQGIAMGFGGLFEVVVLLIYIFIGIRMTRMKNRQKSVATVTIAAVLVSTGEFRSEL
ncbi:hypothetical protein PFISCL1PPCAC_5507 [Pristionchus fissidentatus]|uniref:G protein-coupled receptor n=1 Tax=Pristionchus fissidentatus TaxID=1538716 RepID=A0AAV5V640_9BILA|nr:hypothetical protein PFISCL1PPCAC_5507 [Pristionchus fissidentatus]